MLVQQKMSKIVLIGLILFFSVPSAYSQEETDKDSVVTAMIKDRYTMESDVNRQSGQISVNQMDFSLSYDTKAFERLPVSVWFDYKRLDIDEDVPVEIPEDLVGLRMGLGVKVPVPFVDTDQHFLGIDVMPSMYTDGETWNKSAMRVPFRVYLIYKPSETFVFIAGARIDVNADTPAVPIIGFNYQPNDRWNFHLATTEPSVSYKLADSWFLFGEYDGTLDEYEVTRAGRKGVVLKVREALLGGGLKYVVDGMEASISSGVNMGRRFAYRDNAGKVDADTAPYVKVRLSATF